MSSFVTLLHKISSLLPNGDFLNKFLGSPLLKKEQFSIGKVFNPLNCIFYLMVTAERHTWVRYLVRGNCSTCFLFYENKRLYSLQYWDRWPHEFWREMSAMGYPPPPSPPVRSYEEMSRVETPLPPPSPSPSPSFARIYLCNCIVVGKLRINAFVLLILSFPLQIYTACLNLLPEFCWVSS